MNERLSALLDDLKRGPDLAPADLHRGSRRSAWLAEADLSELADFLTAAAALPALVAPADRLLAAWLLGAAQTRRRLPPPAAGEPDAERAVGAAEALYARLAVDSQARGALLAWLAACGERASLAAFARLLTSSPPTDEQAVMQALAPLFQQRRAEAAALFPDLLACLAQPELAAPVLDLANFLTREGLTPRHPANEHTAQLIALLGQLVQSLTGLEQQPHQYGGSAQELSRVVGRGIALAVVVCDALAQIGDRSAVGKLYQALELGHRRLRTEAAAALARLGEQAGADALVALAAEPVARLRVLAYARELGLLDRIDPQYTTPVARAEAELCAWLAEPTQYGLPPTSLELVDQRRQHWPGFTEEVDCFLFRFQYRFALEGQGERSFSNVGIAGPVAHAFVADLGDLAPDDIYAAFAGWHAEHAEIQEFDVDRLSTSERLEVERFKRRLIDAGFDQVEPQRMGYFFGEKALIARAARQGVPGVAVADTREAAFFPERHSRRSLGLVEAYSIYKGRKLLRAFNP